MPSFRIPRPHIALVERRRKTRLLPRAREVMRVSYQRQQPGAHAEVPEFLRSDFAAGSWERTGTCRDAAVELRGSCSLSFRYTSASACGALCALVENYAPDHSDKLYMKKMTWQNKYNRQQYNRSTWYDIKSRTREYDSHHLYIIVI